MGRSGGPRVGSGRRVGGEGAWIRTKGVRTTFRPQQYDDLEAIAEGWGIPVATVVWAIVTERLQEWRRERVDLGTHGLAVAAAMAVLRMKRNSAVECANADLQTRTVE